MYLRNPFPKEVKEVFYRSRYCLICGRTDLPIELHHITGRGSSSAFNCCRICKRCHEPANHSQDDEVRFFLVTHRYLLKNKYKMDNDDKKFLENNPHLILGLQ